ncbi:MAG: aminoacyl-tRNA hydrolase [Calditrichaceae bacterium]|nr:aminoacyl-tRNA hydrolase [Calditrichia bacterium]NUQ42323.1 aminoacyl-tRNA hydrolase [Calditrichaceae bacterium]
MFAVIGLGNPGKEYQQSRHNIGFMAVDRVSDRFRGDFKKSKGLYLFSKIVISNLPVLVAKPLTYMNLSGQAARHLLDYFKISDFSRVLIVLDDFNLPFGTLRLKPSGTAGGQKGLLSILRTFNTDAIPRLRIGIGGSFGDASSYVLSPFSRNEQKVLPEILDWAADAIESFVVQGIDKTMSHYNRNILENSI